MAQAKEDFKQTKSEMTHEIDEEFQPKSDLDSIICNCFDEKKLNNNIYSFEMKKAINSLNYYERKLSELCAD